MEKAPYYIYTHIAAGGQKMSDFGPSGLIFEFLGFLTHFQHFLGILG